jgi:hypothetical protein
MFRLNDLIISIIMLCIIAKRKCLDSQGDNFKGDKIKIGFDFS